ncbi:tRNA (N6-threonylcarbamoyladenosine(37)-N6)-methyltransferase TrmO [Gephyromycinifex aptenodytis]|uniref:tRNA (N6-threonylcarbamoyladenosine(37)-N6)-methyltransferase TrmO n=1 Tax=Gephyromycinifex aptenodytis TaxID=2716227 RepID=UPI0014469A2C|nr:tRNA (N6-threonylcarbamoyladenosine(37)-N6)-methyltransferase TrmO [Gephyromycinifex aptenodytis]
MTSSQTYEITPVGVLRTPYQSVAQAPIQGAFEPQGEATLEVGEQYTEGLDDIEGFSHLIVVYLLDRAGEVRMKPLPLLDDTPHGVFATRNPRRPNKLGLVVASLVRHDGRTLHLRGVDALDGSPVIDIKPYVARFDSFPDASEGWFAGRENRPKPPGRE